MAHILVTGATGFIATHCIVKLIERGHSVRGTARSTSRATALNMILSDYTEKSIEVPLIAADLSRDAGWEEAVEGVDAILHVASPIPASLPRDADELIKPARDGALRLLRAAKTAGVDRVVMTSSMAAVAYGWGDNLPNLLTEQHWSNPENLKDNTAYTRSKTIAERAAWDYVASEGEGLKLTTINPSAVLGPVMGGDFSASLEIVTQLMSGKLPAVPKFGFHVVDVRDVAEAHILALEKDISIGQRYLVADDFLWMAELAEILRDAFPDHPKKIPSGQLPSWLVRILSLVNPPLRQLVPELGKKRIVSSEKARSELGWTPISAREAAIASAESLIAHNLI
ncbi:MAG: aldehyde reductase [Hyphomonadaceae bacterium]|nr:aldehyde reductase [Hyphomonadaceae bacterium]